MAVPDPSGKRDARVYPAILGKRIEIEPEEAEVVRLIFEWYADGAGTSTIVERLSQAGYQRGPGKSWKAAAVKRVLTNERYRGYRIWRQKNFERRPGTRQKVARPVPRSGWQIAQCSELRIVTDELWRARALQVQQLFGITTGQSLARGKNARLQQASVHGAATLRRLRRRHHDGVFRARLSSVRLGSFIDADAVAAKVNRLLSDQLAKRKQTQQAIADTTEADPTSSPWLTTGV